MEVLSKSKDLRISNDVFKKICRDLKSEINENKKEIEKLNELDYKYSKKVVYPEKLVKVIDEYREKEVVIKETRNLSIYAIKSILFIELRRTVKNKLRGAKYGN